MDLFIYLFIYVFIYYSAEGLYLSGGQRTLQTPHTMQWAVRQQETGAGSTSAVNSSTPRPTTSAVAATTTGDTRGPSFEL